MKTKLLKFAICPCCKKRRTRHETRKIQKIIRHLFLDQPRWFDFFYSGDEKLAYKKMTSSRGGWACDLCLESGAALIANPEQQEYLDWPPNLSYIDECRTCDSCNLEFLFSKKEQLFWYEELKFWVQSDAVDCKSCRALKRERKTEIRNAQSELSTLLSNLNFKSEPELIKVIDLYEKMGSHKRVKYYCDILDRLRMHNA